MTKPEIQYDVLAAAHRRIADMSEEQAEGMVRDIVDAEAQRSGDELRDLVAMRLQCWAEMEPAKARRIVSIYTREVDRKDKSSVERIHSASKDAIAKLPPETRSRLTALVPEFISRNWPSQHQEAVAGRSADAHDAHVGTPVYSSDRQLVGHVDRTEGKYVQLTTPDGDKPWLSVTVVRDATDEGVTLEVDANEIDTFALRDEVQREAGLDAPDPAMDERLDAQATESEKEARREGLVRDDQETA